ncbi:hypothetical protein [Rhodopila sp.]|jgi:hypothetical protein|uniref:hypothetical protein n=1 Tax=Rhodopila sp. TaxID=2480087 RepID=UPI002C4276CD|nr:hypothetical protein [Rhodopila sp.]HVZ06382.1 hypothetical protein [Rhodopila sp.]
MSDRVVEEAYNRVRSRYSDESWFALPPRAVTDAIYQEIRRIDAEHMQQAPTPSSEAVRDAFAA